MGLNSKTNLKSQADLIRYEDGEGKNTAERVGKLLAEIIENTDQSLTSETNARVQQDNILQQTASTASSIANTAYSEAKEAKSKATTAQSTADSAKATAEAAKKVTDTKGLPGGLATLDSTGKVPASQLPGYVDDVVEFNAFVTGITVQLASTNKKSTDVGCMVVYNADTNCFVLAVSNRSVSLDADWGVVLRPQRLASTPSTAIVGGDLTKVQVTDYWNIKDTGITLISSAFTYYNNWADADSFGKSNLEGRVPEAGKIYTCTAVNTTSRWSGSELITIGSDLALGHTAGTAFPGDEGFALQQTVDGIQIFPYDAICYHTNELSGRPEGTIAFAYDEHCFKILKDGEWVYYDDYNTEENFKKVPLTNRIYRYGDTLQAMRKVAGQNYYVPVSYVVGSDEFDSIKARVEDIAASNI